VEQPLLHLSCSQDGVHKKQCNQQVALRLSTVADSSKPLWVNIVRYQTDPNKGQDLSIHKKTRYLQSAKMSCLRPPAEDKRLEDVIFVVKRQGLRCTRTGAEIMPCGSTTPLIAA